jgi:carbon storage regulator
MKMQGDISLARVVHIHFFDGNDRFKTPRTTDREETCRGARNDPNLCKLETAMLVLTRKKSEMIRIGDNVVIKVISTGNGKVKIGIEAPNDVRVVRAELTLEPDAPMIPTQTLRDRVLARRHVSTAK